MSDVAAAYPNGEDISNASAETTVAEISQIEGIDNTTLRNVGINLTGGSNNAIELCCSVMKYPTFDMLSKAFEDHLN